MANTRSLVAYGLAGGVGLFIAMWAFQGYLWYGYQQANPAIGSVSTTNYYVLILGITLVLGITLAYTAFVRGLQQE